MTNNAELLACPFCRWQTVYGTSNGEGSSYIECGNCGARGPVSCGEESDVALWNRRATRGDAELLALADEMENFGDVWDRTDAVTNVDTACRHWAKRLRAIASQPVGLPELPEPEGEMTWTRSAGVCIQPEPGYTADQMRDIWQQDYAARAAGVDADGWVRVPIIPTKEMIAAGDEIFAADGKNTRPESVYDAMVAAISEQAGAEGKE